MSLIIGKETTNNEKFIVLLQENSNEEISDVITLNITDISLTDTNALIAILNRIKEKENE